MTEQLILELTPPEPPSLDNFLPGDNDEALAVVRALVGGELTEPGVVLWGPAGVGKTHLLRAAVAEASRRGRPASLLSGGMLATTDPMTQPSAALVAIDDVETLDDAAQARLFTLYNAVRDGGGHVLVASDRPLAALVVREDVRTRLAWGLVYEVRPLADADKAAALATYARTRGFALAEDVLSYLLAHGRRDMPSLLATLAALDRYSLAAKRPVTVPLLRALLRDDMRGNAAVP